MKLEISEKGKALLIAINCGLCPKVNNKYDEDGFNEFWDIYIQKRLRKITVERILSILSLLLMLTIVILK